jgi:hypothetical protein
MAGPPGQAFLTSLPDKAKLSNLLDNQPLPMGDQGKYQRLSGKNFWKNNAL